MVLPAAHERSAFRKLCLLVGAYLIITDGRGYKSVVDLFRPDLTSMDITGPMDHDVQVSVSDWWRAFDQASQQKAASRSNVSAKPSNLRRNHTMDSLSRSFTRSNHLLAEQCSCVLLPEGPRPRPTTSG